MRIPALILIYAMLFCAPAFFACGGTGSAEEAVLSVVTVSYNDMIYYEPGTPEAEAAAAERLPSKPEYFTVKAGDEVRGEFTVTSVKNGEVGIKTFMEFYDCSGYSSEPSTEFTVKKGEPLTLSLAGLCDAVYEITIEISDPENVKEDR